MMNKLIKKGFYILLFFRISLVLFSAHLKHEETLWVEEGHWQEDYLFSGKDLKFNGQTDDLYFFGKRLDFNGQTQSSLNAIGNKIYINGLVNNNLMVFANEVTISGQVRGTVFIGAETIILAEDAVIDGSLFLISYNTHALGQINADLYLGSGGAELNGVINGNANIRANKIFIRPNAQISGDLTYYSERKLTQDEKSRVRGLVQYKTNPNLYPDHLKNSYLKIKIISAFFILLSFFIIGLVILLLPALKNLETSLSDLSDRTFWTNSLWGLIPLFIYPVAFLICIILVITIPLALILLLMAIPLMVISQIIGIVITGRYLYGKLNWQATNRFSFYLLGFALYFILSFIPVVDFIKDIFFSSLGWGILTQAILQKKLS